MDKRYVVRNDFGDMEAMDISDANAWLAEHGEDDTQTSVFI